MTTKASWSIVRRQSYVRRILAFHAGFWECALAHATTYKHDGVGSRVSGFTARKQTFSRNSVAYWRAAICLV